MCATTKGTTQTDPKSPKQVEHVIRRLWLRREGKVHLRLRGVEDGNDQVSLKWAKDRGLEFKACG